MEILAQKSITEIKNSQQGLHSIFDLAWEKKIVTLKINWQRLHMTKNREKNIKKNEQSLKKKCAPTYSQMEVPGRKETKENIHTFFFQIMAEHFPNLLKNNNLYIQEAQ